MDVELSGRDFRCGCACTSCCDWVAEAGSPNGKMGLFPWLSAARLTCAVGGLVYGRGWQVTQKMWGNLWHALDQHELAICLPWAEFSRGRGSSACFLALLSCTCSLLLST